MKHILLILFITVLAGCTTLPPVVDVKTQTVEIPVAVVCNAVIPPAPLYNFDKATKSTDVFDKVKDLLADRKLSLGYQAELLSALSSCVK